jgi:hypothetical protein
MPVEALPLWLPTVVLLRAAVAAMKSREHLDHARLVEAVAELGTLHDALVELAAAELGEAGERERRKLVDQERKLMLALQKPWR